MSDFFSLKMSDFFNLIVGLIALFVFYLQKRNEKQAAAVIIVLDIRSAERIIREIKERSIVDRHIRSILRENNWAKYKHLFAKDFSQDDLLAFDRFFDGCFEISGWRNRIVDIYYKNIDAKIDSMQEKILSIEKLNEESGQIQKVKVIQSLSPEDYTFTPDEPHIKILREIEIIGLLSQTSAFSRLTKIASLK